MLMSMALAASPLRWDVPQVVSEIQVPAQLETAGIPNRFHVVLSSQDAQGLYDHFHRAFVKAGLHVPPPELQLKLDGQVMLTAFDPANETSYSVILQPYPSGNTLVILGEASFAGRRIAPSADTFAPLFPGAEHVLTSNLEGAQLLSYAVRASGEEVLTFYREILPSLGYTLEDTGDFTRGDEVLQVHVRPRQGARTEVAVMRTLR